MDREQLVAFCKNLVKLKEQLKCPICLDIIEENAELECGHILCGPCHIIHKSKDNTCPLCKKVITRRSSVYKDEFADKIGTFVSKICNIIEGARNCSIEKITHYNDQPLVRKTTSLKREKLAEDKPKNQKNVKTTDDKLVSNKKVKKTEESECSTSITSTIFNEPSISKEEEFDKLIQTRRGYQLNKKGTKVIYTHKKKDKKKDLEYKILEFDNDDTKSAVLQWLNDNRNKFERITQSQNYVEISEEPKDIPLTDLTSVSQIPKKNQSVDLKSKKKLNITLNKKSRARSLDMELNNSIKEIMRHSDVGLHENYNIEESNTEDVLKKAEENVLLNIIEDKYLNKLENDLQKSGTKNKQKEPKNKENEHHTTQSSTSGWDRIEKISKTLIKKGKSPKQLKITLEPSQCSSLKKDSSKTLKISLKDEDIVKQTDLRSEENDMEIISESDNKQNLKTISIANPDKNNPSNSVTEEFVQDTEIVENIEQNSCKLESSGQESDKENKNLKNVANQVKKINILNDVTIRKENIIEDRVDPYLLPTQKLNFSDEKFDDKKIVDSIMNISQTSDLDDSISELNTFDAVMNNLKNKLGKYLENMDKSKNLTKRHIKSIQRYLEKLNDFHSVFQNKFPPQSADAAVQTESFTCQVCAAKNVNPSISNLLQSQSQCNITDLIVPESLTNTQMEPNLENNANFKNSIIRTKSFKKTQNDEFAASLDLLNFETQEIENQYLLKNQNKSVLSGKRLSNLRESQIQGQSSKSNNEINTPTDLNKNSIPNEDPNLLVCSLKSDSLRKDRKNTSRKRLLSDSDSSDVVVPKRKCNRFIRDDLSIEFGTSEKLKLEGSGKIVTGLSLESDGENDEEYLEKILKKYENGEDDNISVSSKKDDKITNEDCDDIIALVNENVENLKRKSDESRSSYKTASPNLDDDNPFLNDDNISKLDQEIRLHTELKGESEIPDIIAESENLEPLLKKPKLKVLNTAFNNGEETEKEATNITCLVKNKSTYCQELEDSLDGIDFENIEMAEEVKKGKNVANSNEGDLFSDEDVVETTPQKNKTVVEKRSEFNVVTNLSLRFPTPDNVNNEFFDGDIVPLAPPPGFEDVNDDSSDITVLKEEEAIDAVTPKKQLQINISSVTPLNISVHKVPHSTPHSQFITQQETLGFSPIVREKSMIEKACDSNNTIISISSQDTPRKRNILTSNPKQRSILNYVKAGSASVAKQKPCIACTRLSKDQIQSISLLTNKKLATYSAKFNDSVTHMIVSVDDNRRIKDYTMKFVASVASGIWVLSFEWVQECLKNNEIVPEELYEAFDDSGTQGPKIARLTRNVNPLFKDYRFYCERNLYSITVEDVEDVINNLGGTTVRNLENLLQDDGKINLILTEGRSTQDFEIYERWLEKYKIVTVEIEWLSKSIGRYKILSVRPYIWCSDDILDELGYPSYLTENTSSLSSEQL